MRQVVLIGSLLLFGAWGVARAQTSPVIDRTDLPVAGDSLRLSQAAPLLPASAPPLSRRGANQTWNYGALVPTAQRVERYNGLGNLPVLLQFTFGLPTSPNRATLVAPRALPLPAGTALPVQDPQEFFNLSNADFRSVGFSATLSGLALPVTYQTPAQQDVVYRFPLSYASPRDSSSSYFEVNVPGTGFLSQRRKRVNRPDAWGTLTTPFGTFQTVRVVTTYFDRDSVALGAGAGQGFVLPVRREYKWLAKTVHVPVLTITTNVLAGQETVTAVEYRDVYRRIRGLAARDPQLDAALATWPNPSAAGVPLRVAVPGGRGPLVVTATDLVGRELFRRSFAGAGNGELVLGPELFGPFRGVALLAVTTAAGRATRRVVRE